MRVPSTLQRYMSRSGVLRIRTTNGDADITLDAVTLNYCDGKDLELTFRKHKLRRSLGLYRNLYLLYFFMHVVFLGLTAYQEYEIATCDASCIKEHAMDTISHTARSQINMRRKLSVCNATRENGQMITGAFWCTEITPLHPTTFFISRGYLLFAWFTLFTLSRTRFVLFCQNLSSTNRWQYVATFLTATSTMVHTQAFFVDYGIFDAVSRDSSPNLVLPAGIEFVVNVIFMVFVSGLRHEFATSALVLTCAHFGLVAVLRESSASIWLITNLALVVIALSWFIRVSEIHSRRAWLNRVRLSRNNLRNSLRVQPFAVRNLRGWLAGDDDDDTANGNYRSRGSAAIAARGTTTLSASLLQGPDADFDVERSLIRSTSAKRLLGQWIVDWNELELQKKIGEGSSSVVWKGTYRGRVVAVKQSRDTLNEDVLKELSNESSCLFKLKHHPHIVRLYGIARSSTGRVSLVLEWCSSNVKDLLQEHPISLETRTGYALFMKIAKSTASAMTFLQNARIAHRDLKPANLLLTEHGQLRVGDFGIARIFSAPHGGGDDSRKTSPVAAERSEQAEGVGTPAFMAPEILGGRSNAESKYSDPFEREARADVYAYGITLAAMLLPGGKVYPNLRSVTAVALHVSCGYRPSLPTACPSDIASLIASCWSQDATKRPLFPKICSALDNIEDVFGSPQRRRRKSFGGASKKASGSGSSTRESWLSRNGVPLTNATGGRRSTSRSSGSGTDVAVSPLSLSPEERRSRSRMLVSADIDIESTTLVHSDTETNERDDAMNEGPSAMSRAIGDFAAME
eukprot:g2083.t1